MSEETKQPQRSFKSRKAYKPKAQVNNSQLMEMKKALADIKNHNEEMKKLLSSPSSALNAYKNKTGGLNTKVNKIVDDTKSRGKLKFLEKSVGEKFMANLEPEFPGLSYREKIDHCAVVYADDLGLIGSLLGGTPAKILTGLAAEYGPRVLDWLYRHTKAKIANIKSHGSGVGLVSVPNSSLESSSMPTFTSMPKMLRDMNLVNLDYLATLFCPEVYTGPLPDAFGPQVCTSTNEFIFTLATDTTGNTLLYVLPDGVTQGTSVTSFMTCSNAIAATANPTTGVISVPVYGAGNYNSQSANIEQYRVTSYSVRVVPNLAAVNNSGSLLLAYNPSPTIDFGTIAPAIPQATLMQYPFLHVAAVNGTSEMRQVHIPHSVTDTSLQNFSDILGALAADTTLDVFVVNGTGLPANASVARVYLTATIDYSPSNSNILLTKPKATPEGPATLAAAASIIKAVPHVTQFSLDEAKAFATFLLGKVSLSPNYADVVYAVQSYVSGYKPKNRDAVSLGGVAQSVNDLSFENVLKAY